MQHEHMANMSTRLMHQTLLTGDMPIVQQYPNHNSFIKKVLQATLLSSTKVHSKFE